WNRSCRIIYSAIKLVRPSNGGDANSTTERFLPDKDSPLGICCDRVADMVGIPPSTINPPDTNAFNPILNSYSTRPPHCLNQTRQFGNSASTRIVP
ncbi:hypothetical protein, partial [Lonsdalea britannica]|uniref:hypothetical protein n=1 Tax=Lonsdalea britannica TaxID=1082704 RepID=UPI0026EA2A9F